MKIFDYIYFRVAKFYYKRDGLRSDGAVVIVSLIQCLLFAESFFSLIRIYFPVSETSKYAKQVGYIGVFIALILLYLNGRRYKNKYWKLSEQWKNSDSPIVFKLKGYLVILAILLPFILLFLMSDIEFL